MQLTEEAPHERHWMQTVYVCLEGKEWGVCKGDSKIGLVRYRVSHRLFGRQVTGRMMVAGLCWSL